MCQNIKGAWNKEKGRQSGEYFSSLVLLAYATDFHIKKKKPKTFRSHHTNTLPVIKLNRLKRSLRIDAGVCRHNVWGMLACMYIMYIPTIAICFFIMCCTTYVSNFSQSYSLIRLFVFALTHKVVFQILSIKSQAAYKQLKRRKKKITKTVNSFLKTIRKKNNDPTNVFQIFRLLFYTLDGLTFLRKFI